MISPSTAALAISVARGLLKLGSRLDNLLAEKTAVRKGLVGIMPKICDGPSALQKVRELKQYLAASEGLPTSGPLGSDRLELLRELKKAQPDNALVGECYRRVFPDRLVVGPIDPDAEYVTALRQLLPAFDQWINR